MIKQLCAGLLVVIAGFSASSLFGYVEVGILVMAVLCLHLMVRGVE